MNNDQDKSNISTFLCINEEYVLIGLSPSMNSFRDANLFKEI